MANQSRSDAPGDPQDVEKKRFQLAALTRRRTYLKMLIYLIQSGLYGKQEDISKLKESLEKTEEFISRLDADR